VIYNWDLKDSVKIDASTVLHAGDRYEVRNAQDFFGPEVASGVFDGSTIALPMAEQKQAAPIGQPAHAPKPATAEFGAFVLLLQR